MDDSLSLGLYLVEEHSGRVLYANHRFFQLAGLEELAEPLRRGELTHARVLQQGLPLLERARAPGAQLRSELEEEEQEIALGHGRIVRRLSTPVRQPGGVARCRLYVFEDVTERKRTEEALHRSALSFRKLVESAPEAIFVHRDRRFIYVNPTLLKVLGYQQPSELLGRPIWEIVHPDDREMVRQRVQAVVTEGQVAPLREVRYLRRDGTWFDAESMGLSVEFDGVEGVMVMARDVTERKRLQAQLVQTDRIAMVGTLAAGVGHEINNPLSYVLANLSLALESLQPLATSCEGLAPEVPGARQWAAGLRELQELLKEAQEGATRVRNIVRDLKNLSRQDEERRSAVDVREALDFSIKMASNEVRHRAHLIKRYEDIPPVYADASRLGQVFLNLLMNAAQAIPEGKIADNHITVWVRLDASGQVAVDVSDTGSGIAPEALARIFDPFFTTKPVGLGTGLGLSICQGIIHGLGGEILARSEVGRGTTITVLLPPMAGTEVSAEPQVVLVPSVERSGRMLVIDDEVAVGRSLARLLGPRHEVTVVGSGREGLNRLSSGEAFDVIFCDLMMPDTTGMEIYERVRDAMPELAPRFVFITGGSFTPRARQFLETVPNRWLEKPFDVQQLQQLLGTVLG